MSLFCVVPWFAREIDHIGRNVHCCLLPKDYDIDQIKKDFLNNQWPSECSKCKNLEDAGLTSDRQIKNSTLDFYWDKDIEAIYKQALNNDTDVRMLTLATSSTCNSQCVTCGPHYSSSWRHLERHVWNIPTTKISVIDLSYHYDLSKLVTLSFIGGEPLYERQNFAILDSLIAKNNTKVFVSMITNGSVVLTEHQKNILRQFPNLNFCISIDGTKSLFEYLRYPLKWSNLLDNIRFLQSLTSNISISYTISNMNIQFHNETIEWFKANNFPYNYNPVSFPAHFSPNALPASAKQHLEQTLDQKDYQALLSEHTDEHETLYQQAIIELDRQDKLKKINRQDFLPSHSFFY
jgi:MoaA/NifB/PqqE/SkfB family radical SAM enzyme